MHEIGRAFDMIGSVAAMEAASNLAPVLGLTWRPSDPVHFEYRGR